MYNNFGCSDYSTIGPLVIYPTPILNAVRIQISLVIVLIISFSGSSSNSVVSHWNGFGDGMGALSSSSNIQYSYNSTGLFNPRVTTTINGCIDSINLNSINIIPQEEYTFSSNILSGCPPLDVNFTIPPSNHYSKCNLEF